MKPRTKAAAAALAVAACGLALVAPAIGQAPESLLPPGFGTTPPPRPAPAPAPAQAPATTAPAQPPPPVPEEPPASAIATDEGASLDNLVDAEADTPEPPAEMPEAARRSLAQVGLGGDEAAFGGADGRYLATLMRRMTAPIASRWAEIALRRTLLAATPAPAGEGEADWVADRARLLLRLGEADAARTLVQAVDVEDFSPALRTVAYQTAFATSDPAALCPLPDGAEDVAGQPAWPMIRAMCAALASDAATANAMIGRAPANDPIDHALAEKVVAQAGAGRRAVQIDWTAVDALTDWRFGLATALNVVVPQALLDAAPAWFQAWLARAPMLAAADRIAPARIAAALGPVSSAGLVDLYGRVMDESGDPDTQSPAGRLRAAYRADDVDGRLAAMHALWDASPEGAPGERDRYAGLILTARAAAGLPPVRRDGDDLLPLIESMLAAGLDVQAERWAPIVEAASGGKAERAWAVLAVGATRPVVTITPDRVAQFAKQGGDEGRQRTALLAAALGGLGRLSRADAAQAAQSVGIDLGAVTPLANALDRAVTGGEPGTVVLLAALALQTPTWEGVPAADFYRIVAALRAVGKEGEARMIAAEAMSRA